MIVKYNSKILAILTIFFILSLFLFLLQSNYTYAQDNQSQQRQANQEQALQGNGNRDFYRVIVENNLFRPLGWTKPSRDPEYVLIATWIGSHGETTKALLMEQRSNQIYYVTTGAKVGNAIIENIKSKQVTLNIAGKILTLKLPLTQFLNEFSRSLPELPNQSADDTTSQRSRQNRINRNQRSHQRNRDNNRQNWQQRLRDEFRNATLEERRRIIETLRHR